MHDLRPKKGRLWVVKAVPHPLACSECIAIVDAEKKALGIQSKEFIPYYRLEMRCDHSHPVREVYVSAYANIPKCDDVGLPVEAPNAETL